MGCGCGGAKNATPTTFVYTDPQGAKTVYKTEIEARARQVRTGGTYVAK